MFTVRLSIRPRGAAARSRVNSSPVAGAVCSHGRPIWPTLPLAYARRAACLRLATFPPRDVPSRVRSLQYYRLSTASAPLRRPWCEPCASACSFAPLSRLFPPARPGPGGSGVSLLSRPGVASGWPLHLPPARGVLSIKDIALSISWFAGLPPRLTLHACGVKTLRVATGVQSGEPM